MKKTKPRSAKFDDFRQTPAVQKSFLIMESKWREIILQPVHNYDLVSAGYHSKHKIEPPVLPGT